MENGKIVSMHFYLKIHRNIMYCNVCIVLLGQPLQSHLRISRHTPQILLILKRNKRGLDSNTRAAQRNEVCLSEQVSYLAITSKTCSGLSMTSFRMTENTLETNETFGGRLPAKVVNRT